MSKLTKNGFPKILTLPCPAAYIFPYIYLSEVPLGPKKIFFSKIQKCSLCQKVCTFGEICKKYELKRTILSPRFGGRERFFWLKTTYPYLYFLKKSKSNSIPNPSNPVSDSHQFAQKKTYAIVQAPPEISAQTDHVEGDFE